MFMHIFVHREDRTRELCAIDEYSANWANKSYMARDSVPLSKHNRVQFSAATFCFVRDNSHIVCTSSVFEARIQELREVLTANCWLKYHGPQFWICRVQTIVWHHHHHHQPTNKVINMEVQPKHIPYEKCHNFEITWRISRRIMTYIRNLF
jgi:hypothetical protein